MLGVNISERGRVEKRWCRQRAVLVKTKKKIPPMLTLNSFDIAKIERPELTPNSENLKFLSSKA